MSRSTRRVPIRFALLALLAAATALAASDREALLKAVRHFEACCQDQERLDQQLERLDQAIDRVRALADLGQQGDALDKSRAFVTKAENDRSALRSRLDRSVGLRGSIQTKIRSPDCSPCIASDVNLFCMQVKSIQNEAQDYAIEARSFEAQARKALNASAVVQRVGAYLASAGPADQARRTYQQSQQALAAGQAEQAVSLSLEAYDQARSAGSAGTLREPDTASVRAEVRACRAASSENMKALRILDRAEELLNRAASSLRQGVDTEYRKNLRAAITLLGAARTLSGDAKTEPDR